MRKKISQLEARNLKRRVESLEGQLRIAKVRMHWLDGAVFLGDLRISDTSAWLAGRLEGSVLCGRTVIAVPRDYVDGSMRLEFYAVDHTRQP